MITDQEREQFVAVGAVTIDTPLTEPQIGAAAEVLGRRLPFQPAEDGRAPRYRVSASCRFEEPKLLDILQHPFFEEVAQRVLGAADVRFFQAAMITTYPQPETRFRFGQHVDIQYSLSDIHATPRRMICSFFLWLTDVNERRAPLMLRPGSHLLIAAERERDPRLRAVTPTVAGATLAELPALPYAEPVPVTARAGQVSVLTTATVHGASSNVDVVPRQTLLLTFTAAGVVIALAHPEEKRTQDEMLRRRLRPDRAHIVAA